MFLPLQNYTDTILTACILFPIVAAAFTLPFAVVQYRRYGGIPVIRVVVVYSFIFYCLCAFLLTVLPLPSREAVAAAPPKPIGWIPFQGLFAKMRRIGLLFKYPVTFKNKELLRVLLYSFELFQVLANIALFVPLGFYCRSYFRQKLGKTLLIGFLVSLFFELTQLTGLFFYYPHAYRYAETGDLISNTLGALIGYGFAALLSSLLPSRETIDALSFRKGQQVTRVRRLVSAALDLLTGAALTALVFLALPRWTLACLPVLLAAVPFALRGSTVGQALVKLRTVRKDGQRAGFWRLLWRNFLLACELFVPPACLGVLIAGTADTVISDTLPEAGVILAMAGCALLGTGVLVFSSIILRRRGELPHSCFSRTSVISYNKQPQEEPS